MKMVRYFVLGFVLLAAGSIILCSIDTASGPTPYEPFTGNTKSASNLDIGFGTKTFFIPSSLPLVIGPNSKVHVTLSADTISNSRVMNGAIKSYNRDNGEMTIDVDAVTGTGAFSNWKVIIGSVDSTTIFKQAYTDLGFGMFIHFNMSTFDRHSCEKCLSVKGEWGLENRDTKLFNPTKLDCGQWARIAKSAGCRYMVLTTKHHDGFCLWPSAYTEYSVKNATITTDICKAFVDSARAYGLKIGFYYSIRDLTNGFELPFVNGQLTELLKNYGEVICLWFDGWGWGPGYTNVPYNTVRTLIKSIQPRCMIVENNHEFSTKHSEIIEYEMPIDDVPPLSNTLPAEGNEPIRLRTPKIAEPLWFWHPEGNCDIMSAQDIFTRLKANNASNAAYLLDLTPDTLGLIPQCQADVMQQVGELLKANNYTPSGKK